MKRFIPMILMALVIVSCATFQLNTENTLILDILTNSGDTVKLNCEIGLDKKNGVEMDGKCIGYFESKDGNSYRCEVSLTSDNKPITENLSVSESCTIEIKKNSVE